MPVYHSHKSSARSVGLRYAQLGGFYLPGPKTRGARERPHLQTACDDVIHWVREGQRFTGPSGQA